MINNTYASFNNTQRILTHKRDWVKRDLNSFAGKKLITRYNQLRLMNESEILTKQQLEELATIFRPNADLGLAINKVKSFLKNEEVKSIADSDLRGKLSLNGIDLDFIIKEQKNLLELSKNEKQYSVTHKVIESLKTDLGLNNKIKITETRQTNSNLSDNYNKAVTEKNKQSITTSINMPVNSDNEEKTRGNTTGNSENSVNSKDDGETKD